MRKWATKGSRGHKVGQVPWLYIEDFVSEASSKVVGCKQLEVTAMNTLTVNIHFALVSPGSVSVASLSLLRLFGILNSCTNIALCAEIKMAP